jgi:hypothetical protein
VLYHDRRGRVAEWFKAPVLKTGVGATPPWVRIPPLPPYLVYNTLSFKNFINRHPGYFANLTHIF